MNILAIGLDATDIPRVADVFERYGFREIRTPLLEPTELFSRSVGESTDIVRKEMYTFERGDESFTLRPENTASVVRAFVEHSLHRAVAAGFPERLYYIGPMFRHERPQKGRQRQFHQIGVEVLGAPEPMADAETLEMLWSFLDEIAVTDREGIPLGVFAKTGANRGDADLAVNLARTGAFFSNDQAPLSSRTVRFISGIHFPPGISNTPNAALYGIENTNRGCRLSSNFNPGQEITPSRSLGGGIGLGIITGKADVFDSDPGAVNRSVQ